MTLLHATGRGTYSSSLSTNDLLVLQQDIYDFLAKFNVTGYFILNEDNSWVEIEGDSQGITQIMHDLSTVTNHDTFVDESITPITTNKYTKLSGFLDGHPQLP